MSGDPRLSIAGRIADGMDTDRDSGGFGVIARVARSFRARSGAESKPISRAAPAFRWGPLEVYESIGAGQFGEVYRAIDPRLDRTVALKLRKASTESSPREFLEEARQLARVRHENVLAIYGADVFAGRVGLWTEYVDGKTLEEELACRTGGYPAEELCWIGGQIARALVAVHESGLLHGDVSARNVIQERGGRLLLSDFGCAVDRGVDTSFWIGTPRYSAPEVLRGDRPTEQSDLYSLAVLLYRLATRRYPFPGDSIPALVASLTDRGSVDWPEAFVSPTWSAVREVIDAGLATEPSGRWPTSRAFAIALEEANRKIRRKLGIPAWKDPSQPPEASLLPRVADTFVGRHASMKRVLGQIAEPGSLTCLVGPGGSGKTRLAVEALRSWAVERAETWFVDLTSSESEVEPRIRRCLGLTATGDEVAFLAERTRDDHGLVFLDNAEHVLGRTKDWIRRVMDECPRLSIMVTSREPLGLGAEVVIPVVPLGLPEVGATWEDARQSEAVQLFLDRCQRAGLALESSSLARQHIPEVCRRFDGLPLGLEIAASHLAGVPPSSWLHQLSEGTVTWESPSAAPSRHRDLRQVVEWVMPLLSVEAQTVFAAAAVFAGGWEHDAAIAVLGPGLGAEPGSISSGLRELWRKSLLRLESGPEGNLRYSMLVTVRTVAQDRFSQLPSREGLRQAHLDYYRGLFLRASPKDTAHPSRRQIWVREELELIAALETALESPHGEESFQETTGSETAMHEEEESAFLAGAHLAVELTEVWESFTDSAVSERFTQSFLDRLSGNSQHRPLLLLHRAGLFWKRGEPDAAHGLLQEAMAVIEHLQTSSDASIRRDSQIAEVRVRTMTALLHQSCFQIEKALDAIGPALIVAEKVGDDTGMARALYARGWAYINSDRLEEAAEQLVRSLEIGRRCDDVRQQARALSGLGMVGWASKNPKEAISCNSEAYDLLRSLPGLDQAGETNVLLGLGSAYVQIDDLSAAMEIFSRARETALDAGLAPLYASAVQSEADIQRRMGNYEEAARLFRTALERQLPTGASRLIARCRIGVATSLAMCGRFAEAEYELRQSLDDWFSEETPSESALTVYAYGVLDRERGNLDRAATWFSAGVQLSLPGDDAIRRALEELKPKMDGSLFDDAVRIGSSLTFSQLRDRLMSRGE